MSKHSLTSLRTPRQCTRRDSHQLSRSIRGNISRCSPSQSSFHKDPWRERDALHAELEAERLRSQEARRRFAIESRELCETAQRNQQLLAEKLRSKWEKEQIHQLQHFKEQTKKHRDAEIQQILCWKNAELREAQEFLKQERDSAIQQARYFQRELAKELVSHGSSSHGTRAGSSGGGPLSAECRAKLEEVLAKLRWDVDGDQAARIRHLEAQLKLERRLFLKYILGRFEGEPLLAGSLSRLRQPSLPPKCKVNSWGAAGGRQQEGLSRPGRLPGNHYRQPMKQNATDRSNTPKIREENNTVRLIEKLKPGEIPRCEVEEKHKQCDEAELKLHKILRGNARIFEERNSAVQLPQGLEVNSWGAAGECAQEGLPQTGGFPGDRYNHLMRQNADLLNSMKLLEERCTHLEEENTLLREGSFPDKQEKVTMLKTTGAELAVIIQRLKEAARKFQESSLEVSNTSGPLALNCSEREFCEKVFPQQGAKELNKQVNVLLAKDQQIEALQKECQELQVKLSLRKETHSLPNSRDLDHLRESQKEVCQLQGQTALKSQKDSLQASRIAANGSSSLHIIQEASPTIHVDLEDSSLAKKISKTLNILKKDGESQALSLSNEAKNDKISSLGGDSKNESPLQLLKKQLVEKQRQCENLMHEVEEKQKRCNEVERKHHTILSENARLSEENSQLCVKNKWAEKVANENADLRVKIIQATEERNSAVQLTRGLEVKVENLEQLLVNVKGTAEIEPAAQPYTEMKTDHEEGVQFLETQVKELEQLHPGQTEHVNLRNPVSIQLQSNNLRPFRLRCVLARYSYNPFNGPNKNPETELPLTAGEYVYICGGMDEDGFYVGELMDGRRGFVPSNLVEEVEGTGLSDTEEEENQESQWGMSDEEACKH